MEPARASQRFPPDPLGLRARLAPREEWRAPALAVGARALARGAGARRRAARRCAAPGIAGLLRNALVAAGNSRDASLAPLVRRHCEGGDAMLAEHARWALARLAAQARVRARGEARDHCAGVAARRSCASQ